MTFCGQPLILGPCSSLPDTLSVPECLSPSKGSIGGEWQGGNRHISASDIPQGVAVIKGRNACCQPPSLHPSHHARTYRAGVLPGSSPQRRCPLLAGWLPAPGPWAMGHGPCAFMKDLPLAISVTPKTQVQYLGIIHS